MWEYKREEQQFEEIPVGDYRCRIESVEKTTSQKGNDMLVLRIEIAGQTKRVYHYVVFMPDRPEITNRNLTSIFDSFGIQEGDFVLNNWVGKAGACHIKHDEESRAKIGYFIGKGTTKEKSLPAWSPTPITAGTTTGLTPVDDEELPF